MRSPIGVSAALALAAVVLAAEAISSSVGDGPAEFSSVVASYRQKFDSLRFPGAEELRSRVGRPFTVNVEGIVGTGKSTFLKFFEPYVNHVDLLPEPVDKWTNLNGTDLLRLIFDKPKRWAMAQESYVQLTMLEEHLRRRSGAVVKVMERSIHSARFVFVEVMARSGNLQKVEYDIVGGWYDFLNDGLPGFDLQCDLTVYLQSEPSVVMDRIRKRGRPEEKHLTMDFLEGLHRLHEDWLVHKNTTFKLPSNKIMVINTSYPLATMEAIYKALAKKILSMVPEQPGASDGAPKCFD